MTRWIERLLFLFVFLIPWNARVILRAGELNGGFWEYGTVAVYATDVLFFLILVLAGIWWFTSRNIELVTRNTTSPQPSPIRRGRWYVLCAVCFVVLSILWSFDKLVGFYSALKLFEGIGLFFIVRRFQSYEVGPRKIEGRTSTFCPLGKIFRT